MNRKIFGLILGIAAVLIVAAVAMGAVSANPTDAKIGNQTFHIPDGFKEVNRTNGTNETSVLFEKDKDTSIIISVAPKMNESDLVQVAGDVNKTISGKNGVYNEKLHYFSYNNEGNYIIVFAPDENMIADIIK